MFGFFSLGGCFICFITDGIHFFFQFLIDTWNEYLFNFMDDALFLFSLHDPKIHYLVGCHKNSYRGTTLI
jgi:hypothetical protein